MCAPFTLGKSIRQVSHIRTIEVNGEKGRVRKRGIMKDGGCQHSSRLVKKTETRFSPSTFFVAEKRSIIQKHTPALRETFQQVSIEFELTSREGRHAHTQYCLELVPYSFCDLAQIS